MSQRQQLQCSSAADLNLGLDIPDQLSIRNKSVLTERLFIPALPFFPVLPSDGGVPPLDVPPLTGLVVIPGNVAFLHQFFSVLLVVTNVAPDDAMIYVNDLPIGEAKQFNTPDEVYDFPAPGSYTIRVVAPGYKERVFVVTAAENATEEIARIDAKLSR